MFTGLGLPCMSPVRDFKCRQGGSQGPQFLSLRDETPRGLRSRRSGAIAYYAAAADEQCFPLDINVHP